jgi:membrane associated rhomboid family serine protease
MALHNNIPGQSAVAPFPKQEDEWIIVARGGPEYILNCSLVLSAVGIQHQVNPSAGTILAGDDDREAAIFELQAFAEENRNWPPPPNYARPAPSTDNPPTLLMIGGLVVFYLVTGPWLATSPWFQAGEIDSGRILEQGQWWRLITALTLHADQVHLVGNCVIGGFMVHMLCRTSGYGTGWLALILSGMAGNLMNIALRNSPHYSVGFSTAIFAAIGIFCGQQLSSRRASLLRQIILPLGAGAGLLAMLGSEGKQTDLGAHLFGLGCGFCCGLLLRSSRLDRQADNHRLQQILFTITLALITGCWLLAVKAT